MVQILRSPPLENHSNIVTGTLEGGRHGSFVELFGLAEKKAAQESWIPAPVEWL
jgi:hypothetical protein